MSQQIIENIWSKMTPIMLGSQRDFEFTMMLNEHQLDTLVTGLRHKVCGTEWTPKFSIKGSLTRGWYRCPTCKKAEVNEVSE